MPRRGRGSKSSSLQLRHRNAHKISPRPLDQQFFKPPTLPSAGERGFGRCRDEAFAAGSSAGWDLWGLGFSWPFSILLVFYLVFQQRYAKNLTLEVEKNSARYGRYVVVSLSPYVMRSRHFVPVWLSLRSIDVDFFLGLKFQLWTRCSLDEKDRYRYCISIAVWLVVWLREKIQWFLLTDF